MPELPSVSFWEGRVEVQPADAARTNTGLRLLWLWVYLLSKPWVERAPRRVVHAMMRGGARTMLRHLHVRLDFTGVEHISRGESYVVVPLHEGLLDVPALLHLPLGMRFVARDELFGWPLLGPVLRRTGQIEVRPEDGARAYRTLVRAAREAFDLGESVVIFPQGTILGLEADFQKGAFHLARTLHRPLLPVALTGSHCVWEHPYAPTLRYGQRISVRVLPPLSESDVRETNPEDVRVKVRRSLKSAARAPGMAPTRSFVPERDGWWDGYRYDIDPDFPELLHRVLEHRREVHLETTPDPAGPPGFNRLRSTHRR